MGTERLYERDTDALFLRLFRTDQAFVRRWCELVGVGSAPDVPSVSGQRRHLGSSGSIDIAAQWRSGLLLLIENKIDAAYSINSAGMAQPERYERSVSAYRATGLDARSVLLAPAAYLNASRAGVRFDHCISYEMLASVMTGPDATLLAKAVAQATMPYEPVPNLESMSFFAGVKALAAARYPGLTLKRDPNADGVRPTDSRTIYFDVDRTLRSHALVGRPRMSLQCWDSAAPSASAKIMLGKLGQEAERLIVPMTLKDIGGYLRPAGRSLGIVIDTPRLDTQVRAALQINELSEAFDAALRLQRWWSTHGDVLRSWTSSLVKRPA